MPEDLNFEEDQTLKNMEKKVLKYTIAGVLTGAVAGYLYYHLIGCNTSGCAITSHPVKSTLYGAIMGGLVFSMFNDRKKQDHN